MYYRGDETNTRRHVDQHTDIANAELPELEDWLDIACAKLSDRAQIRIRRETIAHVHSVMNANGEDEATAIAALGPPKKANRRFKRRYLNQNDIRSLMHMCRNAQWAAPAFGGMGICMFLIAMLRYLDSESPLGVIFLLISAFVFCVSAVGLWTYPRFLKEYLSQIDNNVDSRLRDRITWRIVGTTAFPWAGHIFMNLGLVLTIDADSLSPYVFTLSIGGSMFLLIYMAALGKRILHNAEESMDAIRTSLDV